MKNPIRIARRRQLPRLVEALESRLLMSISASAQLAEVSTTGSGASTVYHYDITLTNTGTTNIGSFWFAWQPGQDYLRTTPKSSASPTGWNAQVFAVNFPDGASILWTAATPLPAGGTLTGFQFSTSDSPAIIEGDSNYYTSTPIEQSQVYIGGALLDPGAGLVVANAAVTPPPPTPTLAASQTTLGASAATISLGDPITLSATVSAVSSAVTPTGTVTFLNGTKTLGAVAVQSNGTATLDLSSLPMGTDKITAKYSGDSTYALSSSNTVSEIVGAAAHMVVTGVPANVVAGVPFNITVSIESSAGKVDSLADSEITLASNTRPVGGSVDGLAPVAAVDGVATFTGLTIDKAGMYTFKATGAPLAMALSKALTVVPDSAAATVDLVKQPASSVLVGANFSPAIVAKVVDPFGNLVSGSKVTVSVDSGPGAITGIATVAAAMGTATFGPLSIRQAGSYTLSAADTLAGSTPAAIALTVNQATPTLAAPIAAAAYTFGANITLTGMLRSPAPPTVSFTGSVTLTDQNSDTLGTANVSATGAISLLLRNLTAATYTCHLNYPGDANHAAVSSPAFTIKVNPAATTTTLVLSTGGVLTAKIVETPTLLPTGTITFLDGKTVVDVFTLAGGNTATFTPTSTGSYTAVYSGDSNYKTSTSVAHLVTIKPVPVS